jgi:hypothetical protein
VSTWEQVGLEIESDHWISRVTEKSSQNVGQLTSFLKLILSFFCEKVDKNFWATF